MYYSDFDGGYENDPANPRHTKRNHDEDAERDTHVGAGAEHLSEIEWDDLHERVHDTIMEWMSGLEYRVSDISDTTRMASNCLASAFTENFLRLVAEHGQFNDDMLSQLIRTCVQVGYTLRQDEESGDVNL